MNNTGTRVKIYSCGVVINSHCLWIPASPDTVVFDSKCKFGLMEIKCAHSEREKKAI